MHSDYAEGTIREKMFHATDSEAGPRINDRHPTARYRPPVADPIK